MSESPESNIYQFRVVLLGISPIIWGRLLVRSDSTIADLHETLQIAFGWSGDHLHLSFAKSATRSRANYCGVCYYRSSSAVPRKLRDAALSRVLPPGRKTLTHPRKRLKIYVRLF